MELDHNTGAITVYQRPALGSGDFWSCLESFGTDSNANLSVFFSVDIPLCVMAAAADMYQLHVYKQVKAKENITAVEEGHREIRYEGIKVQVCDE